MGKKLAIRGHATRGKEVIDLLEMMGGNTFNSCMKIAYSNRVYYIGNNNATTWDYIGPDEIDKYEIFTLEEFLEKYPFKVGDKVFLYDNITEGCVTGMEWDEDKGTTVKYCVYTSVECWCDVKELLKWNAIDLVEKHYGEQCEEMNETQTKENDVRKTGYTLNELIDLVPLTSDSVMIAVREGFEIIEEQGKFFLKKKKSTYPKTYVECCERVNACPTVSVSYDSDEDMLYNDEVDLTLLALRKLFICRNAYRKIAGEEMGLDKPWKPDWNEETDKFTISNKCNKIYLNNTAWYAEVLSFPTAEMRDAFYENFKELIEECKELL